MKAIYCTKYGGPEVLQIREIPTPLPKANEIRIKIHATSVTAADFRIRSFTIPPAYKLIARLVLGFTKPRKPILGLELSGVIDAVGKNVTKLKTGDVVFAATANRFGAYAEFICLHQDATIALKPENCTFEEAATLPVGALTAQHFIKVSQLKPDSKILIYGASGSVGTYAIQFAKMHGAEVTAVCSASNKDLAIGLGADKYINYQATDFLQQLTQYDVVFVAVDKFNFNDAISVVKPNGIYINVTAPFKSREMKRAAKVQHKTIIIGKDPAFKAENLNEVKKAVEQGKVKSVIDKTFAFENIVAAHQYVDLGHKKGNVAITTIQNEA